jgi:hypothetical protein
MAQHINTTSMQRCRADSERPAVAIWCNKWSTQLSCRRRPFRTFRTFGRAPRGDRFAASAAQRVQLPRLCAAVLSSAPLQGRKIRRMENGEEQIYSKVLFNEEF